MNFTQIDFAVSLLCLRQNPLSFFLLKAAREILYFASFSKIMKITANENDINDISQTFP